MCAFGSVVGIESKKKKNNLDAKICTNNERPANSMSTSSKC